MPRKFSLSPYIKYPIMMLLSFVVSTVVNIVLAMVVWDDDGFREDMWILQVLLPILIYRGIIVYADETQMNGMKAFIAVLVSLCSLLMTGFYMVYVYDFGYGRSFAMLGDFLPVLGSNLGSFFGLLWKDLTSDFFMIFSYLFSVFVSLLICYPGWLNIFVKRKRKGFAIKKKKK